MTLMQLDLNEEQDQFIKGLCKKYDRSKSAVVKLILNRLIESEKQKEKQDG